MLEILELMKITPFLISKQIHNVVSHLFIDLENKIKW